MTGLASTTQAVDISPDSFQGIDVVRYSGSGLPFVSGANSRTTIPTKQISATVLAALAKLPNDVTSHPVRKGEAEAKIRPVLKKP